MKAILVNTADIVGGAARAAHRIHRGLLINDVDSHMLVQSKATHDPKIMGPDKVWEKIGAKLNPRIERTVLRFSGGINSPIFTPAQTSLYPVINKINSIDPDIVNLHWVAGGMMRIETLKKIARPIVWTLHDMGPFTGGCHYDNECGRYVDQCGSCPQLKRSDTNDLSRKVLSRKQRALRSVDFAVITPSQWLADCARQSRLLRDREIRVIPNGIDLTVFKPLDKKVARKIWNLPTEKKIVLFGAVCATSDQRKGFDLLLPAVTELQKKLGSDIQLVIFGDDNSDFDVPTSAVGHLGDDVSLATLYSAADVMVVPSRQDNLPNTAVEALACGTPVVGFARGGMTEIINHKQNGYLVKTFDSEGLTKGIDWVISEDERNKRLSNMARNKAKSDYNISNTADKYQEYFEELIEMFNRKV